MLLFMFFIAALVGFAIFLIGRWVYDHTKFDTEWMEAVGGIIAGSMLACGVACFVGIFIEHIGADAMVAAKHKECEALIYQLENNLYDNDNDIGKKELNDEIREWNEDLAYKKAVQRDFWLGIFHPNVYDQFEFIDFDMKGEQYENHTMHENP